MKILKYILKNSWACNTSNKEPTMKKALITGVTGQDGSYLAEFLLEKGYEVIGIKRRTSVINTSNVDHLYDNPKFKLVYGNLNDVGSMYKILSTYLPDEIYNLAAQSHVRTSFDVPEETVDSVAMGTMRLLEAVKNVRPTARFYQASSSEMYGDNMDSMKNENTPMTPASPYAAAKLFSHHLIRNYRIGHKMHASSGILFNHESPRRGETFVTRKITRAAARIKLGKQDKIVLGNLSAKRDWGFAGDYVEAMWLMLQQDIADDYVIATGESRSVQEFLEEVFDLAELDYKKFLQIDPRLYRPHEVPFLQGDFSKAKNVLGWKPKHTCRDLARMMYMSDLKKEMNC
jgi:GDPmannose 4,6-dehydratase